MPDKEAQDLERAKPGAIHRIKIACENCRRKKTKCTGEKPNCSICIRLKQKCSYPDMARRRIHRPSPPASDERLDLIELKLQDLASRLRPASPNDVPPHSADGCSQTRHSINDSNSPRISKHSNSTARESGDEICGEDELFGSNLGVTMIPNLRYRKESCIPLELAEECIYSYREYFVNQPFPDLLAGSPVALESMQHVVLYSLLALCIRTCQHPFTKADEASLNAAQEFCSVSAWKLLSESYAKFEFDDGYFIGLCLLAQADFAAGKTKRAQTQISMAIKLIQVKGWLPSSPYSEFPGCRDEVRLGIIWSLFMMDRLMNTGGDCGISCPEEAFRVPMYQGDPLWSRTNDVESPENFRSLESPEFRRTSIVALNIQLTNVWHKAMADLLCREAVPAVPFWHQESPRGKILSTLLDFELRVSVHSYASVGSPVQVQHEPHRRKYFSTWLFFHIFYCSFNCILNHPFIIHMKTFHEPSDVPRSFLQRAYQDTKSYADWVFRFINESKEAGIMLHDPFLGYLVAFTATIHLDQTLSKRVHVARASKQKFIQSYKFVQQMSMFWPSMKNILVILDKLSQRYRYKNPVRLFDDDEYEGIVRSNGVRHIVLEEEDYSLLKTLLDYVLISSGEFLIPSEESSKEGSAFSELHNLDKNDSSIVVDLEGDGAIDMNDVGNDVPMSTVDEDASFRCLNNMGDDDWYLFGQPWPPYLQGGSFM